LRENVFFPPFEILVSSSFFSTSVRIIFNNAIFYFVFVFQGFVAGFILQKRMKCKRGKD
jgi:hypothetical protein